MGDFNLPNYNSTPEVRVDWWRYWFTNESLPYELGWHPPTSARGADFILSVSSAILAAPVSSTPTPLPSGAIGSGQPAGVLNEATATTTYQLPTWTPYAAPGVGPNDKRDTAPMPKPTASPTEQAAPVLKNPYLETLALSDIAAQQADATSRMAALKSGSP